MRNNTVSKKARTLAAKYYTNQTIFEEEKEKIFFKSWQYACHVSQIDQPESYKTLSIIGQNLFLIRTKDGDIKGFYNVCPHRGHILLEGQGHRKSITCPYHAWTYSLAGELIGARGIDTSSEENKVCLFPIKVTQVLDFIFINLDKDALPFEEVYPGLSDNILNLIPEIQSYTLPPSDEKKFFQTFSWNANWKILAENYLECYHCRTAHKTLADVTNIAGNEHICYQNYIYQKLPSSMKQKNKAFPINLEHDITVGHFWFLFPNTILGQFVGVPGLYVSRLDPYNPEKTHRINSMLLPKVMPDPDADRRNQLRAEWSDNCLVPEDKALCENVQRGMTQKGFIVGWATNNLEKHEFSEHTISYFIECYQAAMSL